MAWIKIPAENHPLFHASLPRDPRVSTLKMFGGVAAMVNGHMFGGLFARSFIVRLSVADQQEALALDGAEPFDPMGNGRVMKDMVFMPENVMDEPAELRGWLARALAHTASLPRKTKTKTKAAKAKAAKATAPKPKAVRAPPRAVGRAPAAKRRQVARPSKRR